MSKWPPLCLTMLSSRALLVSNNTKLWMRIVRCGSYWGKFCCLLGGWIISGLKITPHKTTAHFPFSPLSCRCNTSTTPHWWPGCYPFVKKDLCRRYKFEQQLLLLIILRCVVRHVHDSVCVSMAHYNLSDFNVASYLKLLRPSRGPLWNWVGGLFPQLDLRILFFMCE